MSSLAESIARKLMSGHYHFALRDYCLQWRHNPTNYVMENLVRHLVDCENANQLFEVLIDKEFRVSKTARIGPNAFRADLRLGLEFFSGKKPDLLRYLQLLFIERRPSSNDTDPIGLHERHCHEYQDFLQLDIPLALRKNVGVHKVLNQIFPIMFRIAGKRTIVSLSGYEIGIWTCQCGKTTGHWKRYDYSCQCSKSVGNGLEATNLPRCRSCGTIPQYAVCRSCSKRVSLQLLFRSNDGNLHPAELRLPLKLSLKIQSGSQSETKQETIIMQLPLPINVHENADGIQIGMPDLFWLSGDEGGARADFYGEDTGGLSRFVTFLDRIEYSGQIGVTGALEAMLAKILDASDAKGAFRTGLRKCIGGSVQPFPADIFSQAFIAEIISSNGRIARFAVPRDFVRGVDHSFTCNIGVSNTLHGEMCIADHRVTRPGAFTALFIVGYSAFIHEDQNGTDELTVTADEHCHSKLAKDGIVRIGERVVPGDVLVGIRTLRYENKYAQLLASITGKDISWRDVSLRLPPNFNGRIVSVDIEADKHWLKKFKRGHARIVQEARRGRLNNGERARITVNVAVEHSLRVGDILYDEKGVQAVVCMVASTPRMEKLSGTVEPDIIVGARHPWSADTRRPLTLKAEELLEHTVGSRSFGAYLYESDSPVLDRRNVNQAATAKHFAWLLAADALEVARELVAYHSDCWIWRIAFYERILTFDGEIRVPRLKLPRDLTWCPSESVRQFAFLLRGLGIKATVTNDRPPSIRFELLSAQDVVAESSGEINDPLKVSKEATFNRIHGVYSVEPDLEEQPSCLCSRQRRGVCKRCGMQAMPGGYHRSAMCHIQLPEPVVHPLLIDALSEEIGAKSLGLSIPSRAKLTCITVIPESRRPCIKRGNFLLDSDINYLYSRVVKRAATLKEMLDIRGASVIIEPQRKMVNDAVRALMSNESAADPLRNANKRPAVSLKGKLIDLLGTETTLLDAFLQRRLDYSGWTRLICGDCGGIDSILLPEEIAWNLMEPLILRTLASDQGALLTDVRGLVQRRDEVARTSLKMVCHNSVVLLGFPHGSWPLVALAPTLSSDLAVCIDTALMERVGWQNLGEGVPIFMLLTPNAQANARNRLMPSQLTVKQPAISVLNQLRTEKERSAFNITRADLVEQLTTRAYRGSAHPLSDYDVLAMGLSGCI